MDFKNPSNAESFLWSVLLIALFIASLALNLRYIFRTKEEFYSDYRSRGKGDRRSFERRYFLTRWLVALSPLVFLLLFLLFL